MSQRYTDSASSIVRMREGVRRIASTYVETFAQSILPPPKGQFHMLHFCVSNQITQHLLAVAV